MNNYKLGSLFDGSGGFPLSGALCGIEPVWAAEVEPYPIAVTRSRFPNMKHLGDISKVNGAEIEPVDIITFGSPCQDLSVAGKRAGLKHEANGDEETTRSGLFMEAVRIIKEMREATNGEYPKYCVWENVPGAFSSNNGEDFRIVCEELIKIIEPSAFMPPVPKNGWAYADSFIGDGWSLSYRVFDAQYWGVPQRRRRIYLVTDFRGERAGEILFEREGLRGYFAEGRTPWQTTPADAQGGSGADDREGEMGTRGTDRGSDGCSRGGLDAVDPTFIIDNVGGQAEYAKASPVNGTLRAGAQGLVAYSFDSLASNSMKSPNPHSGCREVEVSKTLDTTDPNPSKNQGGIAVVAPIPYTMKERAGCAGGGVGPLVQENKSATLATNNDQYLFQPAYAVENHPADSRVNVDESGKVQTLTSRMGTGGGNVPMVMEPFCKSARGKFKGDAETWKDAKVANTLNTFDQGESRANELVVEERPAVVYAVDQGGGKSGANIHENKAPTLCTTHGGEPAVAYSMGITMQDSRGIGSAVSETMPTLTSGTCPGYQNGVAYGLDRASFNQGQNAKFDFSVLEEQQPTLTARGPGAIATDVGWLNTCENQSPTLLARQYKDPHLVTYTERAHYIVRRLTPTECARLQGFADWWGVVEQKTDLTEEEFHFWLEVRNTHARINGKTEQDYTKKQMLTWFNKLWTDSAEYKMWGNGIALPTALYCIQGIAEALERTLSDEDDWMN